MKKIQKVILHSLLLSVMVPYVAYTQDEGAPQVQPEVSSVQQHKDAAPVQSRWQQVRQAIREKVPTAQELKEKLPLIQDKMAQAASLLQQKTYCLFKYDACTKRDKILLSHAFGFMAGYGARYRSLLLEKLVKRMGLSRTKVGMLLGEDIMVLDLAEIIAAFAGLTGPLMTSSYHASHLSFAIQGYITAPDTARWINALKRDVHSNKLLILILALDAFLVLKEAWNAATYGGGFSLGNIAQYLKMNAQCIWSENYCIPRSEAESRRIGLYFWLGFLEGILLYQLKIRTWGRRPIGPPPAIPAPGAMPFLAPVVAPAAPAPASG